MYINILKKIANLDKIGIIVSHIGIFIIFIWIGGLKFFNYEAEGIVPFVANNPVMKQFMLNPSEYKSNKIPEGTINTQKAKWHEENNTYIISKILGILIMAFGILVLLGLFYPILGVIGGIFVFLMTLTTLSFLITTPETFVQPLGGTDYDFPYLSGAGRLVIKDLAIMACALIVAGNCSSRILFKKRG